MNAETRAALDRARQHLARIEEDDALRDIYPGDMMVVPQAWCDDVIRLMRLAVTEHHADEDEPIDGEWLERCGWGGISSARLIIESPITDEDTFIGYCADNGNIYVGNRELYETPSFPNIRTRGQLRALCRVLGIEMKEQP
jgi:hypothetical protein